MLRRQNKFLAASKATKWAWHVHHSVLCEPLTSSGLEGRRRYIRHSKLAIEIPLRLRLLKVMKGKFPQGQYNWEILLRFHSQECQDCPYDFRKRTIFTRQRETGEWY